MIVNDTSPTLVFLTDRTTSCPYPPASRYASSKHQPLISPAVTQANSCPPSRHEATLTTNRRLTTPARRPHLPGMLLGNFSSHRLHPTPMPTKNETETENGSGNESGSGGEIGVIASIPDVSVTSTLGPSQIPTSMNAPSPLRNPTPSTTTTTTPHRPTAPRARLTPSFPTPPPPRVVAASTMTVHPEGSSRSLGPLLSGDHHTVMVDSDPGHPTRWHTTRARLARR